MQPLNVSIVPTLVPPPKGTQLVIFADARNYVLESDSPIMLASAARYAARHKVYLVPERFIAANYMCLCLFAPTGEVMGVSRACHLNLALRELNYSRSDLIECIDTPFGKTALLVDVDINMPQVARECADQGATFIISSQFMQPYDFFEDRINYGVINTSRSNGVSVAAAIGLGGVIVHANGRLAAAYSESLPVSAKLEANVALRDESAMQTARKLLFTHSELIIQPQEVD